MPEAIYIILITDENPPIKREGVKFICSAKEDERILFHTDDGHIVTTHRIIVPECQEIN